MDRSLWREMKFINLCLTTNFCNIEDIFSLMGVIFRNLCTEKRVKSKKLQLSVT